MSGPLNVNNGEKNIEGYDVG